MANAKRLKANIKAKKPKKPKERNPYLKTKKDIVNAIYSEAKEDDVWCKAQIDRIVSAVFDNIVKYISEGNEVSIREFGKFSARTYSARQYIVPATQEMAEKPEHKKFVFKSSDKITHMLNS